MPTILENLEKLIGTPRDGAVLRYSIGNEYLKRNEPAKAADHFAASVGMDPHYSAAWKLLGRALSEAGRVEEALTAWRRGIEVAEQRGDKQAAKEMAVFVRRLQRQAGGS